MNQSSLFAIRFAPALLLGLVALGSTGCDFLEKKAAEKLEEELKKEAEKNQAEGDGKKTQEGGDKAATGDGPVWTDAVTGEKVKMSRVKIDGGGLGGLSILAPEGAQVKPSLGGRGMEVSQFGNGFAVWVTEDPTVTLVLMKEAATAKLGKEAKIEHEDENSIIVGGKSPLGDSFYAYMGFFKARGKTYRCETEASQAGSTKAHAEGIKKACESLEVDGKPISAAGGSGQDKATDAPAKAAVPATGKPAKAAAASKQASCKCAKNDLQCNMKCGAR